MKHRRFSALAAAALVLGLGIATAPSASAALYPCASIQGIGDNWAYIKDSNGTCGTVGARHQYTPTPGRIAWTGWAYDGVYARSVQVAHQA